MPIFLQAIGSTLLSMLMALLTGPMIKQLVIMLLEQGCSYYERRAESTPSKDDDAAAKFMRELLTRAEAEWKK